MTLATTFLAATLVVPAMPPPEYDDCDVVFGRDADGDGILSRTEEAMTVGFDCGEWKVVNLVTRLQGINRSKTVSIARNMV